MMVLPVLLHAQNQLVPAPDAVKLRKVWSMIGDDVEGENEVGHAVSGLPDINGDSIREFAVYHGSQARWMIFGGDGGTIPNEPFQQIDSLMAEVPAITDFRADGVPLIVFIRTRVEDPLTVPKIFYGPRVYAEQGDTLAEIGVPYQEHRCFQDIDASELDGRPGSELIIVRGCAFNEIHVYKGGADFRLDTPMVVISDVGPSGTASNFNVHFADIDGDRRTDMLLSGTYPGVGEMLRFYWGDDDSPASWSRRPPDRDIPLVRDSIGLRLYSGVEDFDGDGIADLKGDHGASVTNGAFIYLSSTGKNARTRSFTLEDADRFYKDVLLGWGPGPLNDSTGRHDMLAFGGSYVSGSSVGPDHDYEAWWSAQSDGFPLGHIFTRTPATIDVTGDGYSDYVIGNPDYGIASQGAAAVLAGGPYIPFDDPSSNVVDYPVAGESSGLYLWPNPVTDELHIAWRGDLTKMPARFEIHDLNGELIVEGDADTYGGEMLWKCAGVAAGTYLLSAYDDDDNRIADARIIKR